MNIVTTSWWIGTLGIMFGIFGGVYFLSSLSKMRGELKGCMKYLVCSSIIYVIFSSLMVAYGIMKIEINNILWVVVPTLFVINSLLYTIGSKRLVDMLNQISESNMNKKIKKKKTKK